MFEFEKNKLIFDVKGLEKRLSRRPTKHDNSSLYNKSRKYFGSWNKMMENAGYMVRYYQYPKIPERLIPDISYFLGLLITDGHLQSRNNRYGIYLYTSYLEERKMILKLIKNLFDYNASFYKKKKYGFNKRFNFQISINSKDLLNHINKNFGIPIGNKSLTVKIPNIIINSNKENILSFIRGVIDGDGHITQDTIHINSGSYLFLEDIKKLLSNIGINYNTKIQKEKTCYRLNLNKRDSNKIYCLCYDNAKYFYPRKRDRLLKPISLKM